MRSLVLSLTLSQFRVLEYLHALPRALVHALDSFLGPDMLFPVYLLTYSNLILQLSHLSFRQPFVSLLLSLPLHTHLVEGLGIRSLGRRTLPHVSCSGSILRIQSQGLRLSSLKAIHVPSPASLATAPSFWSAYPSSFPPVHRSCPCSGSRFRVWDLGFGSSSSILSSFWFLVLGLRV